MQKEKRIPYASAKPTVELLGLFQQVEKLDVDGLGRAEIYERAKRYLVENEDKIDFNNLPRRKKEKYDGDLPSSFKVRINDEELDSKVNKIIRDKYNINRVMTPFKIKIVLSAYINYLEGFEDSNSKKIYKESDNLDSLRVKAISLIIKANDEQLNSIIEALEGNNL
jgi:hypothetical protein